jgi:alpha-L-fucosidase
MKKIILICFISILINATLLAQPVKVLTTKSQEEWINAEVGVLIHSDINIFEPETFDYSEKETFPPLTVFKPTKLNIDQ